MLMQEKSANTSQNSDTSRAPTLTAPDSCSDTADKSSLLTYNLGSSMPPDASSDLEPGSLETQPPSESAQLSYTSFEDDATMIQHIMLNLGEDLDNLQVKMGKLVHQLGREQVWDAFLEAQSTSLLKQDGSKRSPGGTFFVLLQKHRQLLKLR